MKRISALLLSIMAFVLVFGAFHRQVSAESPKVVVNGVQLQTTAFEKKGRILVPLRSIFESIGAGVSWNPKTKEIVAQKGGTKVVLTINKSTAYVNGKKLSLDVPPTLKNNQTYVPIRFVSESFGAIVHWDKTQNKAIISAGTTAQLPLSNSYDVVVVGTDPEGISAAIASAREGQKTLLIDTRNKVGGLFTLGKLNTLDMSYTRGTDNVLTKGIFEEFFNGVGRRNSFDIIQAQNTFDRMIAAERNITLVLNAKKITPIAENGKISALIFVDQKNTSHTIKGKQFIDSTQDADFAAAAGVDYTFGTEDYNGSREPMAVTQVFELSGVNWSAIQKYLNHTDKNPGTGANSNSAWGYAEAASYKSSNPNISMRGLNVGRVSNGNVLINALLIVNVDGTDKAKIAQAKKDAVNELPKIAKDLQRLPGFEKAKLAGAAPELYIRETRHIIGEYRLTIDDVLENRDFPDKIAFGNYPVDVQKSRLNPGIIIGYPDQFSIPFRAIVPKGFSNLLVASRSASYDSLAHGSARVVPVGMVVGEAAGIASAYANKTGINFAQIAKDSTYSHIKKIQNTMNSKGAKLGAIPKYKNPITQHWAYEGLKFVRQYALVAGGYNNDYAMEDKIKRANFVKILEQSAKFNGKGKTFVYSFGKTDTNYLTREDLKQFLTTNRVSTGSFGAKLMNEINNKPVTTNAIAYSTIREILK